MSFEVLSNKFEIVDQHAIGRLKGVQEFIHILRERAMYEETYANGLERVSKHTYSVTALGSLARAVSAMKNHCLNKAMQAKLLYESINSDLADSLQSTLKSQMAAIKKPALEGKKLTKDLDQLRDKHNKAYSKYWKACKDCEDLTVLLETQRDMTPDRRNKALSKLVTLKKEVDDALKQYQNSIEAYNSSKQHFDILMPKIMEIYQRQEETRLEVMKDALRKLVVYETAYLRNLQYDIDNLAQAMENINVKGDLKTFVDENVGQSKSDEELSFVPYQGSHPAFQNLGTSAPMATIPHADSTGQDNYELNLQTAQTHMREIMEKVWLGLVLEQSEIGVFQAVAKFSGGRMLWADWMQRKIGSGRVSITEKGMEQLAAATAEVLTQCEVAKDLEVAKVCVEAAAVIHVEENRFLWHELARHSLWKAPVFWEKAVELTVTEDTKEGAEVTPPVVTHALGVFLQPMLTFQTEKALILEVAGAVGRHYALSTEDLQPISQLLGEEVSTVIRGVPQWLEEVPSPRQAESIPPSETAPPIAQEEPERTEAPSAQEPVVEATAEVQKDPDS